eukprot:gene2215-2646_t
MPSTQPSLQSEAPSSGWPSVPTSLPSSSTGSTSAPMPSPSPTSANQHRPSGVSPDIPSSQPSRTSVSFFPSAYPSRARPGPSPLPESTAPSSRTDAPSATPTPTLPTNSSSSVIDSAVSDVFVWSENLDPQWSTRWSHASPGKGWGLNLPMSVFVSVYTICGLWDNTRLIYFVLVLVQVLTSSYRFTYGGLYDHGGSVFSPTAVVTDRRVLLALDPSDSMWYFALTVACGTLLAPALLKLVAYDFRLLEPIRESLPSDDGRKRRLAALNRVSGETSFAIRYSAVTLNSLREHTSPPSLFSRSILQLVANCAFVTVFASLVAFVCSPNHSRTLYRRLACVLQVGVVSMDGVGTCRHTPLLLYYLFHRTLHAPRNGRFFLFDQAVCLAMVSLVPWTHLLCCRLLWPWDSHAVSASSYRGLRSIDDYYLPAHGEGVGEPEVRVSHQAAVPDRNRESDDGGKVGEQELSSLTESFVVSAEAEVSSHGLLHGNVSRHTSHVHDTDLGRNGALDDEAGLRLRLWYLGTSLHYLLVVGTGWTACPGGEASRWYVIPAVARGLEVTLFALLLHRQTDLIMEFVEEQQVLTSVRSSLPDVLDASMHDNSASSSSFDAHLLVTPEMFEPGGGGFTYSRGRAVGGGDGGVPEDRPVSYTTSLVASGGRLGSQAPSSLVPGPSLRSRRRPNDREDKQMPFVESRSSSNSVRHIGSSAEGEPDPSPTESSSYPSGRRGFLPAVEGNQVRSGRPDVALSYPMRETGLAPDTSAQGTVAVDSSSGDASIGVGGESVLRRDREDFVF